MPVYDYLCKDCRKTFEKVLTLAEYDKQKVELSKLRRQERGAGTQGIFCRNFQEELSGSFAAESPHSSPTGGCGPPTNCWRMCATR